MTIGVKATKAEAATPTAAHDRYLLKHVVFTKTPLYVGALIAALVLYLRTFFSPQAETASDPGEESQAPEEEEAVALAEAEEIPEDLALTLDEDAEKPGPNGSGSPTFRAEPSSFVMLDSPSITYKAPEVSIRLKADSFEVRPRAMNDNLDFSGIGSGGGGGGNGGGGGSQGPDPEDPDDDDDDGDEDPVNRAPRSQGTAYLGDFVSGHAAAIAFAALLQNVSDADADPLRISHLSVSHGTLTAVSGGWIYTPDENFAGMVMLTYQVGDGKSAIRHAAELRVVSHHEIDGTPGADTLVGTTHKDEIDAGEGDDNVDAREGHDTIWAYGGNDNIKAGLGNDIVVAGAGNDLVFAGGGNDTVFAGPGNDRVYGEDGDDVLIGEAGDDQLHGGPGNDVLDGGPGNDTLMADEGDDALQGGTEDDVLHGMAGDDVLDGGTGADLVYGGEGDDVLVGTADAADDVYDGGAGEDTLDYSSTLVGVVVNLETGKATGVEIGTDLIQDIETIIGGEGDDTFIVTDTMTLSGGSGNDDFHFAALTLSSPAEHRITDFRVGDRIHVGSYNISSDARGDIQDLFNDIYGEEQQEDRRPIRYHNERIDEMDRTRIEADLDGDTLYELAINLDGHHVLFIAENLA